MSRQIKEISNNPPTWLAVVFGVGFIVLIVSVPAILETLEKRTGTDLVLIGLVVTLGVLGVYYWRKGERKQAMQGIAYFAVGVGFLAGWLAYYEHEQRNKSAQRIVELKLQLLAARDASEKVMREDAFKAVMAQNEKETVLMYLGGGVAGCSILFVVMLLANVVARGPETKVDEKVAG
jgi:hypothetical protein